MTFNITMSDIMRSLKPVPTCGFMEMCANYLNDARTSFENGETHYEISGLNTKSGHPETFEF